MGTAAYVAPEQARGEATTPSSTSTPSASCSSDADGAVPFEGDAPVAVGPPSPRRARTLPAPGSPTCRRPRRGRRAGRGQVPGRPLPRRRRDGRSAARPRASPTPLPAPFRRRRDRVLDLGAAAAAEAATARGRPPWLSGALAAAVPARRPAADPTLSTAKMPAASPPPPPAPCPDDSPLDRRCAPWPVESRTCRLGPGAAVVALVAILAYVLLRIGPADPARRGHASPRRGPPRRPPRRPRRPPPADGSAVPAGLVGRRRDAAVERARSASGSTSVRSSCARASPRVR